MDGEEHGSEGADAGCRLPPGKEGADPISYLGRELHIIEDGDETVVIDIVKEAFDIYG